MPAPANEPSAIPPVIYSPPRPGLPYLVVTFTGDKVEALPAPDRHQARLMLAQLAPKPKSNEPK